MNFRQHEAATKKMYMDDELDEWATYAELLIVARSLPNSTQRRDPTARATYAARTLSRWKQEKEEA